MILKVNDTNKFNISMNLNISYEDKEISIHVKNWNKQTGVVTGFDYPAEQFAKALEKFDEIEKCYQMAMEK